MSTPKDAPYKKKQRDLEKELKTIRGWKGLLMSSEGLVLRKKPYRLERREPYQGKTSVRFRIRMAQARAALLGARLLAKLLRVRPQKYNQGTTPESGG